MNTWKGNEKDWRASIPSIDDLHDMFKLDQINSTQYAVLLDFYSNPRKVSDQSVIEMINAQISLANSERNYLLSQYNLLKSIGLLHSDYLKLR